MSGPPRASGRRERGTAPVACGQPIRHTRRGGRREWGRGSGQVRHRHELGEHLPLEEVRPPIDEGGPVARHRIVAPGVFREDPPRAPAEVIERTDRLRGRDGPGRHRGNGHEDDGQGQHRCARPAPRRGPPGRPGRERRGQAGGNEHQIHVESLGPQRRHEEEQAQRSLEDRYPTCPDAGHQNGQRNQIDEKRHHGMEIR